MTLTEDKVIVSSSALYNVITREKNNNGAIFTIKSISSNTEFTYTIARKIFKGKWYTHISVEQGYLNFNYLGSYFKGKMYRKRNCVTSPSAKAIGYVLSLVEKQCFDWLDARMEVMHTGSCLVCGRVLTDSNSIKLGLGPICAHK